MPKDGPASTEQAALPLPDKPSIAVLAFDNLSDDPEQDYFADAIAESITAELSRFGGLFVISRNSAFTYKDKSLTAKSIGRGLGVRYVLEGSVQKGRDSMRVTVQLIDAAEDTHVWAETYDRPLEDILMVQDEITKRVVSTLGETIWQSAARSLDRKPLKDFTAYDFVLKGQEHLHRFTPTDNVEARRLYIKARDLDPSIFQAHSGLAWTYFLDWLYRLGDTPDALERALTHAQKAAEVEPNNGEAPRLLARIHLAWRNFDQALALSERAVALNPNSSDILVNHGLILAYLGRAEEGIGWSEKAVRLNPHHPAWYRSVLALGQYLDERYEEAVKTLASNSTPDMVRPVLPAAYVRLGRLEDARRHAQAILEANPDYNLHDFAQRQSFQNSADLERYLKDLRAAGLPE
jgi:adenylate cyclase